MNTEQIKVETKVNKDTKTTWDAYTLPEHIVHWNFATDDWQCPSAENDLRVGGKYKARMEAKDGSFGFDFESTYDAVDMYKKIEYTIADGRKCSISFHPNGDATDVIVLFEAENQNPAELQRQGWQMILDNFKKYTDTL